MSVPATIHRYAVTFETDSAQGPKKYVRVVELDIRDVRVAVKEAFDVLARDGVWMLEAWTLRVSVESVW